LKYFDAKSMPPALQAHSLNRLATSHWHGACRLQLSPVSERHVFEGRTKMRKTIVLLSLLVGAWLACAGDANAQVAIFGRRGGVFIGGGNYGWPAYAGGFGYYGWPYYGGGYYSSWYAPSWYGAYSYPYASYYYPNYYSGYSYVPAVAYPSAYYQMPDSSAYYTPSDFYSTTQQARQQSRESFYYDPNVANMTIFVPNTNAEIWFDGAPTQQRGMERNYHTFLNLPGTYTIRARWNDNGRVMEQTRKLEVEPGKSSFLDFRP
jgi:hypothetical protein